MRVMIPRVNSLTHQLYTLMKSLLSMVRKQKYLVKQNIDITAITLQQLIQVMVILSKWKNLPCQQGEKLL
jgi:hypothetical protein